MRHQAVAEKWCVAPDMPLLDALAKLFSSEDKKPEICALSPAQVEQEYHKSDNVSSKMTLMGHHARRGRHQWDPIDGREALGLGIASTQRVEPDESLQSVATFDGAPESAFVGIVESATRGETTGQGCHT